MSCARPARLDPELSGRACVVVYCLQTDCETCTREIDTREGARLQS